MYNGAAEAVLDPEFESALELIRMLEAARGNPELLKEIIRLLNHPSNTLEEFLEHLLNKLMELIPSDLAFIGLVTENEGGRPRVVVRQPDQHIIGALKGKQDHPLSDFAIGGDELPRDQRSLTGFVAHTKQARRIPDVTSWAEETGFYRTTYDFINSELSVPILFEDRDVLGIISMQSTVEDYYKDEQVAQLQWVARLISRVLDAFMNRAGYRKPYLTVLDRISQELIELRVNSDLSSRARTYLSRDSRKVLNSVAARIATALNSASCEIWILTRNREEMLLEGSFPEDSRAAAHGPDDLALQAMKQRCLLRVDATASEDGEPHLAAPLLASDRVLGVRAYGVVRVTSPNSGAGARKTYTIGDERLLNVLQQPLAIHVHLKHLEWERRAGDFRRAEHVNALLDIFADIDADIDLDTVVQRACEKIISLCDALHCSIFIRDEAAAKFERRASSPLPEGAFLNKKYYEPGEGLTGWVAQHGLPLNLQTRRDRDLEQIRPRVDWKNKGKYQDKGLIDRPFVAVPIKLHGKTLGVIRCTDKRGEKAVFTEADGQILLLIAAHIASAIAFQQRYEGELKLLKNIRAVLDVVKNRYQTPEADQFETALLTQVVDAARTIFRADVAIIYRLRHDALSAPIKSGSLQYEEYFGAGLDNQSAVSQMLSASDDAHYYPDSLDEPSLTSSPTSATGRTATGRFVIREGICSSAAIKIQTAESVRGILFLNYRGNPKSFSPQFKELLRVFTGIASVCVELSELHRDSIEIAEQLQNAVIPELVRDVIVDAGIGNRRLQQHDYEEVKDYLYAIESSAQRTAALLSDIVRRMAGKLTWAQERT